MNIRMFRDRLALDMEYALCKLRMGLRMKFGVSIARQVMDEINLAEIYQENSQQCSQ